MVVRGVDPIEYVGSITPIPLLFVHSQDDPIIPYSYVEELFEKANQPKKLLTTRGRHTATFNKQENRQRLIRYLDEVKGFQLKH